MMIRCVLNDNMAIPKNKLRYSDLLEHLLATLSKHNVRKDEVEIIYVPPLNEEHINSLNNRGYSVSTKPVHPLTRHTKYAFKFYLFENPPDDLITIDVDTLVYDDPHRLTDMTRGFMARTVPSSYHKHGKNSSLNRKKYYMACRDIGVLWKPPFICNGHMVFKNAKQTEQYAYYLEEYLKKIVEEEIEPWMGPRYKLFMASMLSVLKVFPRREIWFGGPEEIGIERNEYVYGRCVFLERQRLGEIRWQR